MTMLMCIDNMNRVFIFFCYPTIVYAAKIMFPASASTISISRIHILPACI